MPTKALCGFAIDSPNEILSKIFLFYAIMGTGENSDVKFHCLVNAQCLLEMAFRLPKKIAISISHYFVSCYQ